MTRIGKLKLGPRKPSKWRMRTKRVNAHTALVKAVVNICLLSKSPRMHVWVNNTGAANYNGRFVKFGEPGTADILGFTEFGRAIAIECKTGTGKLTKAQTEFAEKAIKYNVAYALVRSIEDLDKFILELQPCSSS